jgi:hypothetical protein
MDKNDLRTKSIGTRVSDEEYAALEKLAEARGLKLSEWVREVLLEELIAHPAEQVIVAEVLGLREILLNLLWRMSQGEKISENDMREMIAEADAGKRRKAEERLGQGRG